MLEDTPSDWRAGCDCELCSPVPAVDPLFLQAMERISALRKKNTKLKEDSVRLLKELAHALSASREEREGREKEHASHQKENQQLSAKIEKLHDRLAGESRDYNRWARDWKEAKAEDIRKLNEKIESQKIQAEWDRGEHKSEIRCDCEICTPALAPAIRALNEKLQKENAQFGASNKRLLEENQALQAELSSELGLCKECDILANEAIVELRVKNVKLQEQLDTEIAVVLHLDGWLTKRDDEVMRLEASLANRQELIVLLNEQNNGKNKRIKDLEQKVCQQMEVLRHV